MSLPRRPRTRWGRLWHALTRPRGRSHGAVRHRRSGVALLLVISILMITTVIVTEVTYNSRVRMIVSTHQRDQAAAYWLARSGVLIYHLVLVADRYVEDQVGDALGIPLSLWEMVPIINTGLFRMVFAADDSQSNITEDEVNTFLTTGQVSDEIADAALEESGGLFSDKAFLDFDGEFSAVLEDEDSKIPLNNFSEMSGTTYADLLEDPTYQLMMGLFSTEEAEEWFYDRDIDRIDAIANVADWVDSDNTRMSSTGGYEDSLYDDLDDPYLTKNAPFDSLEELRLVDGWQDELYDKYKDQFTIWGANKINYNGLSDEMLAALLKTADGTLTDAQLGDYVENFNEYTSIYGGFDKRSDWVEYWEGQGFTISEEIEKGLKSKSRTFKITSTGLVNNSSVTITAVISTQLNKQGDVLFWKVD